MALGSCRAGTVAGFSGERLIGPQLSRHEISRLSATAESRLGVRAEAASAAIIASISRAWTGGLK